MPEGPKSPVPRPGGGWHLRLTQLACWYFALLVPTIAFKVLYIRGIGRAAQGGESWFLTALGRESWLLRRAVRLFFVLRPDLIEVALVVAAFYVVGALLLRIRVRYLVAASLALCFMLGAANSLSTAEVGTLLTRNVLSITWDWALEHPEVVTGVIPPPRLALFLALLLLAALWSYWATIFAAPLAVGARPGPRRIASLVALLMVAVALLTPGPILPRLRTTANDPVGRSRLGGYWGSTAISLFGREPYDPRSIVPPSAERLAEEYRAIVYPGGRPLQPDLMIKLPRERVRPRHIVIIGLETAPAKYYPLVDRSELPVFQALAKRALVGVAHHGSAPGTWPAISTILSGTYVPPGRQLVEYGPSDSDALPAVLGRHGYESTYIDSYKFDWHKDMNHLRILEGLEFSRLREAAADGGRTPFENALATERASIDLALQAVLDADQRGNKAFVFVMTVLGHFPWKAKPEDAVRPAAEKLLLHARFFDDLVGSFLASLEAKGLREDIVLVVTGDHGLRFGAEFKSLHEPMMVGDAAFHVPLIIYAPGLFDTQVTVPHATFHVDLAPTLLELVGISTDGLMLHGENLLDRRMAHRVSFFLNRGLSPVDGFYWEGRYFTVDNLTSEVSSRTSGLVTAGPPARRRDGLLWVNEDTRSLMERGYQIINTTAAYFLKRAAQH